MELYYTTDILKHFLLLFLCKVDFLTIKLSPQCFPAFCVPVVSLILSRNCNTENEPSPPVAGFVVYLLTIYEVKKEQALLSKLKRLKIVSLHSDLLIYGNGNIWILVVLYLPRNLQKHIAIFFNVRFC